MTQKELSDNLEAHEIETISSSGMDLSEKTRSASFLQQDSEVNFSRSLDTGIDIMSTEEALERLKAAEPMPQSIQLNLDGTSLSSSNWTFSSSGSSSRPGWTTILDSYVSGDAYRAFDWTGSDDA